MVPAGVSHVVDELCSLGLQEAPERWEGLLKLLDSHLTGRHGLDIASQRMLKSARIFPVLQADGASSTPQSVTLRALNEDGWYIPDRTTLESAFRGRVDILKISVPGVPKISKVIEALGGMSKLLSRVVEVTVLPSGDQIRDVATEDEFVRRERHIAW